MDCDPFRVFIVNLGILLKIAGSLLIVAIHCRGVYVNKWIEMNSHDPDVGHFVKFSNLPPRRGHGGSVRER